MFPDEAETVLILYNRSFSDAIFFFFTQKTSLVPVLVTLDSISTSRCDHWSRYLMKKRNTQEHYTIQRDFESMRVDSAFLSFFLRCYCQVRKRHVDSGGSSTAALTESQRSFIAFPHKETLSPPAGHLYLVTAAIIIHRRGWLLRLSLALL